MALSKEVKRAMGLFVLTLFVGAGLLGYKVINNIPYKTNTKGYIEIGIQSNTIYKNNTNEPFEYLFYAKLTSNKIPIPQEIRAKYNLTETTTGSIIIPNKLYSNMWQIQFFDAYTGEKLDLQSKMLYKSGTRWYNYPPKTADLTLTTTPKYFKIQVIVPKDTAVNGLVNVKVVVYGQEITFSEDPTWFINGNPKNINVKKECFVVSTSIIKSVKTCIVNEPYIELDKKTNKNITKYREIEVPCDTTEIDYQNRTECKNTGYIVNDKEINYEQQGYECSRNGNTLTCDSVYDGNGDGTCDTGETCAQVDMNDLSIISRLDSKSIKELKVG